MSTEVKPTKPVNVYISYASRDEYFKEKLLSHLSTLQRQGAIESWDIQQIRAGDKRDEETLKHLNEANIILCLLSADFMSSDYHHTVEMQRAFERQKLGELEVIPILLRPVQWQQTSFYKLQAIPRNEKPITSWLDRDKAFTEVAQEVAR
ncbi:MAG: toll/interleukin-1 receptor domain-containing protein, partial [Chloroflexota bacterium]|nr:toll/interleukin-1 receptor domain-containing protein [Chloroflexota bacterium]